MFYIYKIYNVEDANTFIYEYTTHSKGYIFLNIIKSKCKDYNRRNVKTMKRQGKHSLIYKLINDTEIKKNLKIEKIEERNTKQEAEIKVLILNKGLNVF
jgi:hypothetical protein